MDLYRTRVEGLQLHLLRVPPLYPLAHGDLGKSRVNPLPAGDGDFLRRQPPCIIHLIRNTFRFASRKYWDQIAKDLRPVYTAASEAEALARFEEFEEKWGKPYPAVSRLWRNAWSEFVPFLDYDVEIRKIICSTNAIESINARYRGRSGPAATSPTTRPR